MTIWTEYLSGEGAALDNNGISFGNAGADADILATGSAVVPLVHLGMVQSTGPDSAPYLHNLFSNDVNKLPAGAAQWNSFNSPKGRMLASFLLWHEAEGHSLVMSADILPAMHKKLSMYILRSKVKLSDVSAGYALIGLTGKATAACLAAAALPFPAADMQETTHNGVRVIRLGAESAVVVTATDNAPAVFAALRSAGAVPAGTDTWQLAMVRAGLPLVTAPTQEAFVAQMLNYDLIGGISFQKGCYPGQEIVARTKYLGKLKKRMYRVSLAAGSTPAVGADLFSPEFGDQSAGVLVNVAALNDGRFEALAVMQTSAAESNDIHLGAPDGPRLEVLSLPYALA
ncbi:folate-binding protein YgfZ [Azoarcus sp. L1K30]|uniref:CAF17-like 4Fe-4S cluster assembly/insertion protein YgfZ n=1 Tax=Azoarcus sp. L1K30 TaxID=2820277 RepID=UPI001B82EF75|nr:folate-binding protein YgfZ [Azoarcus sp. L1K30]MBR0565761.1 folate-binding protein YgfZ [Azoarcus sp. L1K30]